MNIEVKKPRYHDNKVLVRSWNLGETNRIVMTEADYKPLVKTRYELCSYPVSYMWNARKTKRLKMHVIPLEEFQRAPQPLKDQLKLELV